MRVYSRHLTKLRHIEETKGPEKSGSFVLGKEKLGITNHFADRYSQFDR